MDYRKFKTDKERAVIAPYVPTQKYIMLMDWAAEAKDPGCKQILEHCAWRAFHIETE